MASMTIEEIRATAPAMAIWMADAVIRKARQALTGTGFWPKPNRNDYNLPQVEMASAVLFNMFLACEADIRYALMDMPQDMDGMFSFPTRKYFDEFVKSIQRLYDRPMMVGEIQLREEDWILAMK